ncbi:EAL domain-containing protein [Pelagibacterium limicola]|uniref:EAL domain-containing protein n=1 Tax=Pelagibacterium limicola TaxID=2791022 RepID=UPI0018AF8D49|nr:EAL domain-containing protein [Pelagibacterium limicola]
MRKAGAIPHAAFVLLWLLVAGSAALGVFEPADQFLYDQRYAARTEAVTGDRVYVAIDPPSLEAVGVWPWPRTIHAQMIDALLDAGAHEVVLDIDFSTLSTVENDAALAEALERAGGYAYLAAFNQALPDGTVHLTVPAERFRRFADMVAVNVNLDTSGIPRSVPHAISAGETAIPSLAALSSSQGKAASEIIIDYGIRAATLVTLPAIDVIEGRFSSETVAGKTVVVGASALELQDVFRSPNQGFLPGAVVQILAAETAAQQRIIRNFGSVPALAILAVVVFGFAVRSGTRTLAGGGLVVMVAVLAEIAALALYHEAAIMLATAPLLAGIAGLALLLLLFEKQWLQHIVARLTGERDRTRDILGRVVADNFDGIVIVSSQQRIISASAYAERWLGQGLVGADAGTVLPEAFAQALQSAFAGAGTTTATSVRPREVVIQRPRTIAVAEYVVTVSQTIPAVAGQPTEAFASLTFRDVTARRASEDRLQYLAAHDDLTGTYSRNRFVEILDEAIAEQCTVYVLAFNLPRFAAITATLGHEITDELLRQVARRLGDAGYRCLARLGGDSFALAVLDGQTDGRALFGPVAALLVRPYKVGGHFTAVGFAGGWTSGPAQDGASLLQQANLALVEACAAAGNPLVEYNEAQERALDDRRRLDGEMRLALEAGQFHLAYQPQYADNGRRMVGAEALLRWQHPERGPVSPLDFLPVAEETGLIVEIGRMVLERACREALKWPDDIRLAVNVSPLQFELCDMFAEVALALEKTGFPASRLELEITEGLVMRERDAAIETLRRLSALGVKIAIDDFGTGFSSLSYLSDLPFDVLKIDKSFVDALGENAAAAQIVESVIGIGRQLGKSVIAEGVETQEQAALLGRLGCAVLQGYLYGRPMAPEAIADLAAHLLDRQREAGHVRLSAAG